MKWFSLKRIKFDRFDAMLTMRKSKSEKSENLWQVYLTELISQLWFVDYNYTRTTSNTPLRYITSFVVQGNISMQFQRRIKLIRTVWSIFETNAQHQIHSIIQKIHLEVNIFNLKHNFSLCYCCCVFCHNLCFPFGWIVCINHCRNNVASEEYRFLHLQRIIFVNCEYVIFHVFSWVFAWLTPTSSTEPSLFMLCSKIEQWRKSLGTHNCRK